MLITKNYCSKIKTHPDPKGNVWTYLRDDLGRIVEIRRNKEWQKTLTYGCCSLNAITDQRGTITFGYDSLRNLVTYTDIHGKTIGYGYDPNGNLTTLVYPDGKAVRYNYDKADRLVTVTDWLANLTTYQYDLAGRLSKALYPDKSLISNQYDQAWNLKTLTDLQGDGIIRAAFGYQVDKNATRGTAAVEEASVHAQPRLNQPRHRGQLGFRKGIDFIRHRS